eukprot:TRINITY_DN6693_c0_g1_i1.p1 TRINITY_DN6693_c0_g1~~TRINITY_DN6693_c0_g1_i1.p1  ORF type:complete len:130 (-),score=22.25 TRINITY_DN6693_c0_g1_i1:573-962(-)
MCIRDRLAHSAHVSLRPTETPGGLLAQLLPASIECLPEALGRLGKGEQVQTMGLVQASTEPRLMPEHCVINWVNPANMIDALLRGCQPWPGATTSIADVQVCSPRAPQPCRCARLGEQLGEPTLTVVLL